MNDIVTDVIREKRRITVIANGEEKLRFSRSAYEEMPLAVQEHIDLKKLKEWLVPRQYHQALSKAVSLLAIRARSSHEIRQRLESEGYVERTIELVLYKLEKERFLNDEVFARDWALARTRQQPGKRRIFQELRQKGISSMMAEQALAQAIPDEEEDSPIVTLAQKLLRRVQKEPDPQKAMQKVLSAMARRGFSFEESKKAVELALSEADQ